MSNDSTRYLLICVNAKNTKIDISIFKITCLLGLHGAVKVETVTIPPMKKIEKLYQTKLELGGRFKPKQCIARHRVAIIVPYRDREEHLRTFLLHMHSYLPRQQLGMISHKKSLITIFGHKHEIKNFIFFIKKFQHPAILVLIWTKIAIKKVNEF